MKITWKKTQYFGKQHDTIPAVIGMALPNINLKLSHLDCLTARPFAWVFNSKKPKKILSPLEDPWSRLKNALSILGTEYNYEKIENKSLTNEKILKCLSWVDQGPVIIGPLDRTEIWDRIESMYFSGDAYFMAVLKREATNELMVHDPEGCPYFNISINRIINALKRVDEPIGMLQTITPSPAIHPSEIVYNVLSAGYKKNQLANEKNNGGANGLSLLSEVCASQSLNSSEEAALYFALPSRSSSLINLIDFFHDYSTLFSDHSNKIQTRNIQILELLDTYQYAIGNAMGWLKQRNWNELSDSFKKMAQLELTLSKQYINLIDVTPLHIEEGEI